MALSRAYQWLSIGIPLLMFLALWAMCAEPAGAMTDEELVAIRDGFAARRDAMLKSLAGTPFKPAAKRPPLKPGRGRYTRHYSYSVTDFAMKAFLLDEQLETANQALQENCRFYTENELERNDRDSFYWAADVVCRMVEFFGPHGSMAPGRLTPETETAVLEMAWVYCKDTSNVADAETAISQTWHIHESENHHLQRFSTVWHFSKFLKNDSRYSSRLYDDGKTPAQHYQAWTDYTKEFLRERAKKGLFVEVASKGYGFQSLKCIHSFYDFADDPTLRRRAGYLLDLFWATWAEEQIDGVRGGGKTRVYQGRNSQFQTGDAIDQLAWYYLGRGKSSPPQGNFFSFITSDYRMPLVVMDMALDTTGRGSYEITQRRMGLALEGYYGPPDYRLRTDFGGILRYSYCTPDFIVGTLMCEARPFEDWTMISSQNRWHGVVFAGDPNARIYPQCRAEKEAVTFNQQWSVQKKGTLISQRLAGKQYGRGPEEMRVWFSQPGLENRQEKDGWILVEAPQAYAAVRPVAGESRWAKAGGGDWLCLDDASSPVIIEVASKKQFADYRAFQGAILAAPIKFDAAVLTYTGLSGDRFTFYADYSQLPQINDQPIDLAPKRVFDSPFVQSDWNSGVVTIQKGERKLTLYFNSPVPAMERLRISEDGEGFVLAKSGQPFLPWGFNFVGEFGRIVEEYWADDWPSVEEDFRRMRELGANVVRLHLQVGTYMKSPKEVDQNALGLLRRTLDLGQKCGLYLDLTGLGCYHLDAVPPWFDGLSEAERWEVQARFWDAIAKTCAGHPAVFCYDLMNEPVVGKAKEGEHPWLLGELEGFYFVQRISNDPKGRTSEVIAEVWVSKMVEAIRKHDRDALVTAGVIPWAQVWPTAKPLFYAPDVARHLDFVSVHFYPKSGEKEKTLTALAVYDIGKPLVVEEIFPLKCSMEELDQFIDGAKPRVDGWISHYFGNSIEEHAAGAEPSGELVAKFLEYWREKGDKIRAPQK